MSNIEIYTRNESGNVSYIGDEGWESREQVIEHYWLSHNKPEREELLGWPHPAVTWYGDLGFGEAA